MARQIEWVFRAPELGITARLSEDELYVKIYDEWLGGCPDVTREYRLKAADVCHGDTITLGSITFEIGTRVIEEN